MQGRDFLDLANEWSFGAKIFSRCQTIPFCVMYMLAKGSKIMDVHAMNTKQNQTKVTLIMEHWHYYLIFSASRPFLNLNYFNKPDKQTQMMNEGNIAPIAGSLVISME